MKKTTILIADDDLQLLDVVTLNLELEGYHVLRASDGKQALEQIERHNPDLVLLDVMMPRMSGFAVCHQVREFSAVPIIVITARGQERDKIRGLDLGADDYLVKPFSVGELLARVRAVLRRAQFTKGELAPAMCMPMTVGDLSIDFEQHLVLMAGRKVALTPTEYRILAYLAQHAGSIVLQERLLEHIWGTAYVGDNHMLQVNINRLRRKLEHDPAHPHYLLTEPGIGYLLATPPEVQEAHEPG
ncbi:MAG TPA: response regulator transcription factor [Ktedonobacteraceae bacterium]|nr:response regulator transcription factor [Ktedonobacteraceae bacterium]